MCDVSNSVHILGLSGQNADQALNALQVATPIRRTVDKIPPQTASPKKAFCLKSVATMAFRSAVKVLKVSLICALIAVVFV